ncbi:uncharacterized protein LOC129912619 [Episyrphus balteatus]|uniref:uncharacterized protein LOC129912619 n=1 Tax=Episyrphus balteatus TaxID=286459 RepID=UPI002486ACC5|nr:uncharacterized protein LOC129912619 [Episyrphus balteatus]
MLPHILSIVLAIVACAVAKPSGIVPILGPGPIVTAHSHQFVARTYNGIVTPTVSLLPPLAATPALPAPRFYPSYLPTYPTGYYPYNPVYRYGFNNYPWGAYGPTYVRYPLNPYW